MDSGNSCGEPEISNPAIVADLNANIGLYGGPLERVMVLRGAASTSMFTDDKHTKCHGTLVFNGGKTQTGLLLMDQIQGVAEWRWHSDEELSQGTNSPAHKKAEAAFDDDMRNRAETRPNEMVGCGLEGPRHVYTTQLVCFEAIMFVKQNQTKLKPYAGYAMLPTCASLNSKNCLMLIHEMQFIAATANIDSKQTLTERCAADLTKRMPGSEMPQNMNACEEMVDVFR